ncbi:MAG: serine hydrolase domain-containing protein [Marinagarivorans sp.]
MIKHKFAPFAILTLLGLGGLSTQAHAAVKEKTTNTKTTTTAVKKTATTKKADKPAAKNTSKKPTAAAKTSKTTTVKAAAAPKATSSKDDIAWAQGVGAISKFKPDGSKPYYKQFEDYVREVIAPRVPGAALTMVADGQVQVLEGFGTRSVGSTLPVNPDTVFRLASVSKTFASGAAAIAVRDKLLSWDTPVQSKVPYVEFSNPNYGRQLTLKDILAQRSGLPKHTYTHLIEENVSYSETLERLKYVNFACPPRKCYSYQNVVYSLSGDMIKAVSGKTYEAYTTEKLFRPLNMQTASFGLNAFDASPNKAMPHVWRSKGWSPTGSVDHNYYSVGPAAGVNASIRDMSQWLLAQLGHKQDVLPVGLLNDMQQKITPNTLGDSHYADRNDLTNTHYGLGWRIFDFDGQKNFAHHGGWVQGYRAEIVFNRQLQIGMAFLTNSETKLARNIIFKYLDLYEDDLRKGRISRTMAAQ